jgi:small-conductance mechanosensitive channel
MEWTALVVETLWKWLPVLVVAVGSVLAIVLMNYILFGRGVLLAEDRLRRQLLMILACGAAVVVVILALPLSEATRGQLLGLLGLVVTAAIALSSTTLIGNAMAGFMLRVVGNFRVGDFVQIGDHFGRVSDRGLFHIEIQTEDRDLTTLPNMYVISHPLKVVRESGTIVSATVSLGYDTPRRRIEEVLVEAVGGAGLTEPFVQILDLGDFSVTYRAAGLLPEVRHLLAVRSRLRASMMDALHQNGIEIVSPTFMNQRVLQPHEAIIPVTPPRPVTEEAPTDAPPKDVVFDKAEAAETREALREEHERVQKRIEALKQQRSELTDEERERADQRISRLEKYREQTAAIVAEREKQAKS